MKRSPNYWRNLGLFTLGVVTLAMMWTTVWLAYTRAVMLVRPTRYVAERAPSDVGFGYWEEVTFHAPDGVRLRGWFIPPHPQNRALIIFVHGLGDESRAFARRSRAARASRLRRAVVRFA
jgi:hypothetical protein